MPASKRSKQEENNLINILYHLDKTSTTTNVRKKSVPEKRGRKKKEVPEDQPFTRGLFQGGGAMSACVFQAGAICRQPGLEDRTARLGEGLELGEGGV